MFYGNTSAIIFCVAGNGAGSVGIALTLSLIAALRGATGDDDVLLATEEDRCGRSHLRDAQGELGELVAGCCVVCN